MRPPYPNFLVTQSLIEIGLIDLLDILVVALVLFQLYRMIRRTPAMTIFVGITFLAVIWLIVRALNMELTSAILGQIMGAGFIALLIVFQQEVRKFLIYMGSQYRTNRLRAFRKLFSQGAPSPGRDIIDPIVRATLSMASIMQGALIVIERKDIIDDIAQTGTRIDALVQARLIESIFFKNAPLHDGALLIRDGRLLAAQCILPVSQSDDIPPRLGLRHRAAIGLTETCDALVIVVSEETGAVSLVHQHRIDENLNAETLSAALRGAIYP